MIDKETKILFVDDEPVILDGAREMLSQYGFEVIACSSSDEALRLTKEELDTLSCAIVDMELPRLTGRELSDLLKTRCPSLPVIFTSGYGASAFEDLHMEDGFIAKPFRFVDVVEKIRNVLSSSLGYGDR